MSETTDPGKPAVLRQEGPHRVKVAPGSQSALAPSVSLGTQRLPPAVGSAPAAQARGEVTAERRSATLRQQPRAAASSSTEVRHLPGRAAINGRFAPGAEASGTAELADTNALEQRLSALAELNSTTSKTVTAFESRVGSLGEPVSAPVGAGNTAPVNTKRSLFKRRAS
ncbi:MAG: hypothetical protein EBS47_07655 [Betaproteobacteria bacterium]|jgi:hypothetical protein|nr:hypothetical protein [Betaproteobacteria bacterium]NBT10789.1 hypothetical protein [Betaproteobacteria bacterium]NBU49964.1 hypothetical protein [Betaproteobacteria bacterium]